MENITLKIGVALSGGGVRAAAFHLGVLGRLASENLLEHITFISTVSGGTLAVGLVYSIAGNRWPSSGDFLKKHLPIARQYMTKCDLQRDALCSLFLKPWYLLRGRAKLISQSIQRCWHVSANLQDIPFIPRWVINATAYESGKNWRFTGKRMGDYVLKYVENPSIQLSDAMAASAAYPGLIGPLVLKSKEYKWFQFGQSRNNSIISSAPQFGRIHLWDGGVYDNLGVEALFKPGDHNYRDEYNFLIVSDASKGIEQTHSSWLLKRAYRLVEIAMDQVRSLRARNLVAHFEKDINSGVYLKIGNTAQYIVSQGKAGDNNKQLTGVSLSEGEVRRAAEFATTLRKLSENDFDLIYRHGWEVANFTLLAYCHDYFKNIAFE